MSYKRKIIYQSNYIRKLKKTNPRLSRLLQLKNPCVLGDVDTLQHPALPDQITQSYSYSIEKGLVLHHISLRHYKWLMISIMIIIFPLLWWLNNSNASLLESPPNTSSSNASIDQLKQKTLFSLLNNSTSSSMLPGINSMSVLPSIALRSASLFAKRTEDSLTTSLEKVQSTLTNIQVKLPQLPPSPWLKIVVRSGDTLSTIFQRNRLNKDHLHQMLALKKQSEQLQNLYLGQKIRIKRDPETGDVEELIVGVDFETELRIHQTKKRFVSEIQPRDREISIISTQITVHSSLYKDAKKANVSQDLINNSLQILHLNKDFINKLHRGDQFNILYERYTIDKKQKDGNILAVKFVTGKKKHIDAAVRYTNENGVTAYYTPEGDSFEEAFLKSPVPSARITSYFGVREHPIFHLQRQHKGIDYAAPNGTPVLAVSEGKITSVGWQSGYGKVVEIKHSDKYSSLYAHLSKYASQLAEGQSVERGQVIAYIGRTGVATGPHLHFELHIDGTAANPLTAKLPNTVAIAKKYRTDFLEESKSLMAQLEPLTVAKQETVAVANTDAPLSTPRQSKLAQLVNGSR